MSHLDPPTYMEEGSEGMIVNAVLKFLDQWAEGRGLGPTGIILDGKLGATGVHRKLSGAYFTGFCK